MRDFQRARVYRAEEYLDSDCFLFFSDIGECREYAESIWSNPRIRARFPKACKKEKPLIKLGRSETFSHAYFPPHEQITLAKDCLNDYDLIHEIAHIIAEREYSKGEDWIKHGQLWTDTHLFLVKMLLGNAFYANLVEAFEMEGVRYTRHK